MSVVNVGFRFNTLKKAWLAGFLVVAGAATAGAEGQHYELIDLEAIHSRQSAAKGQGLESDYLVYKLAADAIEDTAEGLRSSPNDLPPDFNRNLYSVNSEGEGFKVIDPYKDIDWTEHTRAIKTVPVKAEFVSAGTVVDTVMANGLSEIRKTAGNDGGYRVTNPDGEQYLIDKAKFDKIYEATDVPDIFRPKPEVRKIKQVDQNIAFQSSWGEEYHIRSGGVLVRGDNGTIRGIQAAEYKNTYTPV